MARVGWLKATFFGTPIVHFLLRMGHFENVETLVLNAGPFPEVLIAITENESFRNLRCIHFGDDRGAWILDYPTALRFNSLTTRFARRCAAPAAWRNADRVAEHLEQHAAGAGRVAPIPTPSVYAAYDPACGVRPLKHGPFIVLSSRAGLLRRVDAICACEVHPNNQYGTDATATPVLRRASDQRKLQELSPRRPG